MAIPAASAADLTDPEIRGRLDRGDEVVEVDKIPGTHTLVGTATGVIDAPPEEVWAVLNDYRHYPEFMPHMKACFMVRPEVLERIADIPKLKDAVPALREAEQDSLPGDTVLVYDFLGFPFPVADRRCIIRSVYGPARFSSHYTQVRGDMKVNEGSWQLLPYGDRTLAIFTISTDIGVAIPGFLIRLGTRRALPGIIEGVRKQVKKVFPKEPLNDER